MNSPFLNPRLTPRSRELSRGSYRFWHASALRSVTITHQPFEPGRYDTCSWVFRGGQQYNIGRRTEDDREPWTVR